MPENIFSKRLARWRLAYRNSGLRRFLSWWGGELEALIPARWRDLFVERREVVEIRASAEGYTLTRRGIGDVLVQHIPLDADSAVWQTALMALRQDQEVPADLVLLLPRERVLLRKLHLPLAAEDNLPQVIGFEMDRQTPFKADQVRFDHQVRLRDPAARLVHADVLIAPRPVVEAAFAPLLAANVPLDAIDAAEPGASRLGFNLLPQEARAAHSHRDRNINLILAAAVVMLAFSAMSLSIENREAALLGAQADVDAARVEARRVSALETDLTSAVEGANFLTRLKHEHPLAIDLIRDLTERLPDNTSLQRLSVNRGEVQIQGSSAAAEALIPILQKSPLIESPAMQGATTPDPRTQKWQFMIQAKVRRAPVAEPESKTGEGADAVASES